MTKFILLALFFLLLLSCNNDQPKTDNSNNINLVDSIATKEIIVEKVIDSLILDSLPKDTIPAPQKAIRPTRSPAKMKFDHIVFNYDTIKQGEVIKHEFQFKNIGERPLVINNVLGSCGCTIASYPFLDIAPNQSDVIKSKFDSKGKKGNQETTITVQSNGSPKSYILTLKGYVKE